MTIYTGKNIDNWENSDCFRQLAYVCTVPEGQKLAPSGQDHITGKWGQIGGGAGEKATRKCKTNLINET